MCGEFLLSPIYPPRSGGTGGSTAEGLQRFQQVPAGSSTSPGGVRRRAPEVLFAGVWGGGSLPERERRQLLETARTCSN
eukprot:10721854-Alexandrium_andersonii.AAC.1